jgi:hypothetical protein
VLSITTTPAPALLTRPPNRCLLRLRAVRLPAHPLRKNLRPYFTDNFSLHPPMGPLLTSTDAVVPPAAAHPMPSLQRRYSVTGQTPPDHGAAAKSPKSQALDTSVPTANCNLCNSCRLQNGKLLRVCNPYAARCSLN